LRINDLDLSRLYSVDGGRPLRWRWTDKLPYYHPFAINFFIHAKFTSYTGNELRVKLNY